MKEVAGKECGHSVGAAPGVALYNDLGDRHVLNKYLIYDFYNSCCAYNIKLYKSIY